MGESSEQIPLVARSGVLTLDHQQSQSWDQVHTELPQCLDLGVEVHLPCLRCRHVQISWGLRTRPLGFTAVMGVGVRGKRGVN